VVTKLADLAQSLHPGARSINVLKLKDRLNPERVEGQTPAEITLYLDQGTETVINRH
jgi:hypothetical protein